MLGYCHRHLALVRIIKKVLLRSGLYDLNRFVSGHHYVVRVKMQSGIPITLHLDDHIDNIIWWYGYYEKHPTNIFRRLLKPGDNVIDVGANIGYYSILAGTLIGKNGNVFAYEPVSSIYHRLLRNIDSYSNIKPKQAACGNTKGEINIYVAHDICSSGSRISQPQEGQPLKQEVVPIIRLDDELKDHKINLLKIDVEGYETEVILGAAELIKSNPEIKIFLEINRGLLNMAGSSPEKIFNLLTSFGLQPWKVEITGNNYSLLPQKNYWKDENLILFAKKEYLPVELTKTGLA